MTADPRRKRIVRTRIGKTGDSDPAMLAGIPDERIAEKTGHRWREWVRLLDAGGAAALSHREIAALVRTKHGVGDWWAQTVTVGYERIKGRREINQRLSGEFEAGRSKTLNVALSVLFEACANDNTRRRWLDGVDAKVRTVSKPKAMRLQWPDGTIVVLGFTARGPAKTSVSVTHTKLPDRAALERAKQYWTDRLEMLASLCAPAPG